MTTDQSLRADKEMLAGLRELKQEGGDKRYIHCRFDYNVALRLEDAGLATIDTGLMQTAMIRLTITGRSLLADSD